MKAVVMSIGAELLGGFLTDTNSTFLAQDMSTAGIELVGVMQVGDELPRIVKTLQRATEDAELVVITGGVGPTEDDLTREAIAEFVGEDVRVDSDQLALIERFFSSRGIGMPKRNEKQAWMIPSAEGLPNPVGTAPGWYVRHNERIIVSMPGVPREMTRMWREQVLPRLADRLGDNAIVSTTVKTIGIGESAAEDLITHIIHRGHPIVATYAKNDGVHIRITASHQEKSVAEKMVTDTEREIRNIFGPHAYGFLETRLGEAIMHQCQRIQRPIRVVEAGGAGRITNMLAEETDYAEWFIGGSIEEFSAAAGRLGTSPDQDDAPLDVARALVGEANDSAPDSNLINVAIVVRISAPSGGERRKGDIAYCMDLNGERIERTRHVEANPSEIRRRTALWASEFLHVSLASSETPVNR